MASPNNGCSGTVTVLLEALNDKEDSVNNSIIKSLNKIAASHPNDVVDVFCEYYKNTPKIPDRHLANIVKVLEQTCVNGVKSLQQETSAELVTAMLRAMTHSAEYSPSVQMGASAVLVAIGHQHYDMVLRALISEVSAATVPHYTLPHTLGTLAAVNTHATVPHIKEILSKMIPLLPLVKTEGIKQAFAYAFGHFAVAVSEQIGDNVENDNITSIKDNFVVEFSIIFDVLFNQWLHSHEPKLTESVLEALGPITRLISERKFNETVNKFTTTLLTMYRRPTLNAYIVSQCISYLLSPSPLNPKLTLNDNVLNSIVSTLFQLVLLEPDYDQPQSVKNHFEILRCFDHMAEHFPDMTIESLLHQCKNNQEKERIKAVIVLTHLTTSSQIFIDKYTAKFVTLLKVMIVNEQNLKMKKVLVKAIVGLVYRNCVSNEDDFAMVEFIIKNCSYEGTPTMDKSDISDLQDTCRSSLFLLCNTVTNVRHQLCSLLLKSLLADDFIGSVTTVTHCLTNLLQNRPEVISEEQSEKPKENQISAELIFVRCLMFLIDPSNAKRNKNVLLFLEEYSGEIHKSLKLQSNVEVQRLVKYVDNNESEDQWHGMLRDLLISSVDHVNSNKWLEVVSLVLSQQILSTKQTPAAKGVSLQFLAILSCHMTNPVIVEKMLNVLMHSVRTTPMVGCPYISKAVGIASRGHGDYVLNELDLLYRDMENKRSNKFLNFISSKHSKTEAEANVMKYVLITCYGAVAKESMDVDVLARLSEHVTSTINDVLKSNPNLDLSRASLTALYEIAKALHPAPHHNVVLRNRWQLLNVVLEQLFNNNVDKRNVELFPIIVKASKALTKLQKGILPEERNTILRLLFNSIFGELSLFKQTYEKEGNETQNDLLAKTLNDSLNILHSLIKELVIQSTCLSMIDDLMMLLLEWLNHQNDDIRAAATNVVHVVFDTYIKNVKLNYETPSKFGQMGYLLGILVPKTTDTNFAVRLSTMDNIKLIIQIQDLYEGHTIEPDDVCMNSLKTINNNILTNDLKMITDFSIDLSNTICEKIPQHQLVQFIESILECFDDQEYSSTGISAVLQALFKSKGLDLYQSIERIVEAILETMDRCTTDRRLKLLTPLASLAHHHSNAVTAVLLSQPLPLKPVVSSCWRHIARDCVLSTAVVDNFVRTMTSIQLFEDPYHVTENHIAALQPLTLISALGEMLEEPAMHQLCLDKFPDLFAVLYTTLASYAGALPPAYTVPPALKQERFGFIPNRDAVRLSPAKITLTTFTAFLQQANCHKVKEACWLYNSSEQGEVAWSLPELAPVLVGALCRDGAPQVVRLVNALAPYARSSLPPHRCAVLAFFGELLNFRCNDNAVLTESVMATLSSGCADSSAQVRVAALRGLAHVGRLSASHRAHYLSSVLSALSQTSDVQHTSNVAENVPLASIQGLCRLLSELDTVDTEYHRELLSITQKIRPFMNTEEAILRENSLRLFGIIASKVKSAAMVEQAMTLLPCFLLHLCDENSAVVRASKFTLKSVFSTLGVKRSNAMVQTHLLEEGRLYHEEFLAALLRLLSQELPRHVPLSVQNAICYLASGQDDMRAYAALMIGTLYSELTRLMSTDTELEVDEEVRTDARARLVQLLKEPNARVRQHAASALASVCLAATSKVDEGTDADNKTQ